MTLPASMTAIVIEVPGGPEALVPRSRPVPTPGPGQLLVRVAAAGVNRPDVMQRAGKYPPPPGAPADIPGLEIAGEVVALGEDVGRFTLGDRVAALVPGGGYAEYCVVHETNALPVPAGLSMVEAAALPETYFTVWSNMVMRGHLESGEAFLVHGGTSGIGTTAIQLAKALGATVIATAGSPEKCNACTALGADLAIDYRTEDFVARSRAFTGNRGVDLVLDMVGGDYVPRNLEVLAEDGRLVQISTLTGAKATIDFRAVMLRRLTITGSTLRPRPIAFKAGIAAELEAHVWPWLAAGKARPVIDSKFPLAEAAAAHARMESSAHIGKIVLTLD